MKYLDKKFSSRPASKEYREGWDAAFPSRSEQRRKALMRGGEMPTFGPGGSNRPVVIPNLGDPLRQLKTDRMARLVAIPDLEWSLPKKKPRKR